MGWEERHIHEDRWRERHMDEKAHGGGRERRVGKEGGKREKTCISMRVVRGQSPERMPLPETPRAI